MTSLLAVGAMFLALTLTPSQGAEYCRSVTSPHPPGAEARVALLLSLRKSSDSGQCGVVTGESLQMLLALRWAVRLLNQGLSSNSSFVPGIRIGLELYDDCRNPIIATGNALDLLRPSLPPEIVQCDSSYRTPLLLGALGPTRSSTAQAVLSTLAQNGTWGMPIVSPSATLTDLTNRSRYPVPFFRTAPPDSLQAKTMVAVLRRLRWKYVAVVYTSDAYGRHGLAQLRRAAAEAGVCLLRALRVTDTASLEIVVRDLVTEKRYTLNSSLGVIYFGHSDNVRQLMFYVKSFIPQNPGLHWFMSEAVGANFEAMREGAGVAYGTLTVATSQERVQAAQDDYAQTLERVGSGQAVDLLVSSYLSYHQSEVGTSTSQAVLQQISYVPLILDALYAFAVALRTAHQELCGGVPGSCQALEETVAAFNFTSYLAAVTVNYTEISEQHAPREFVQHRRVFSFREGEIFRSDSSPAYVINSYQPTVHDKMHFEEVGNATTSGEVRVDLQRVRMRLISGQEVWGLQLPWSSCKGACNVCRSDAFTSTAHMPGDIYLLGIFSLHEANGTDPYQCGGFRHIALDAIYLEGFLTSVQRLREKTGVNFGAVVFDDCYSAVRITTLLSQYLDPDRREENLKIFGHAVPRSKILAVVGGLSSDVTLQVARLASHMPLPVISYAASTPDLDDRDSFPLFLRTVPSDKLQAEAMAAVVAALGWKYVGLIYVNNNYGKKGKEGFLRAAQALGVCVASPLAIPASAPDSTDILFETYNTLLRQDVTVVVFFGIDTRISEFLGVLRQNKLLFLGSEDWGDNAQILEDYGSKVLGAITIKLQSVQNPDEQQLQARLSGGGTLGQGNPWFSEYLQNLHSCNLREGFLNTFSRVCQEPLAMTPQDIQGAMADQRLSHVMNSAMAVGKGYQKFKGDNCNGESSCPAAFKAVNLPKLVSAIRGVHLYDSPPNIRIFNSEGNGAIGFDILNIQSVNGKPDYVKVGDYSASGELHLPVQELKFYDAQGNKVLVSADCGELRCELCAPTTVPPPSPSQPTSTAPITRQESDFRQADVILLCAILLVLLVLSVAFVITCCYFRRKVTEMRREMEKVQEGPVYQAVSDRHVYQYGNVPDVTRGIRFDNAPSSRHPSPSIKSQGYINPAFQDPYSTEMGRLRSISSSNSSDLMASAQRPTAELPPLGAGSSVGEGSGGERPRTLPIMSVSQLQQLQQQQQRQMQQEQFMQQQLLLQEQLRQQQMLSMQQLSAASPQQPGSFIAASSPPHTAPPGQARSPSLTPQDAVPSPALSSPTPTLPSSAPAMPSLAPRGSLSPQERSWQAPSLPARSLSPQDPPQELFQLPQGESPPNPPGDTPPPGEVAPHPPSEMPPYPPSEGAGTPPLDVSSVGLAGFSTTISRV